MQPMLLHENRKGTFPLFPSKRIQYYVFVAIYLLGYDVLKAQVPTPSASSQLFCKSANATVVDLAAEASPGYKLSWYNSPSGGTSLYSDIPLASGTYYVSQSRKIALNEVSTIAGSSVGLIEGEGAAVKFSNPNGLATDASGNIFVVDEMNHRIRKITPGGLVSTFAGSTEGFADGTPTFAKFSYPSGVAVDPEGNVYVADRNNFRIRKITPEGTVSTLAGNGTSGYTDGPGASAKFRSPHGLAIDASGNIYVAEYGDHRIRKITSEGVVSTVAGTGVAGTTDGSVSTAQFNNPTRLTLDTDGNIYVADQLNQRVRKITPAGTVSTIAGTTRGYEEGAGIVSKFSNPTGIARDNEGNLYIADEWNNRIRKITPEGVVTSLAGTGNAGTTDGPGNAALFNGPTDVAIDYAGDLYVTDRNSHRVRKITLSRVEESERVAVEVTIIDIAIETVYLAHVSCNGGADGSITVTASDGQEPYTYSWNSLSDTVASVTGLYAGTYTVTVGDLTGCSTVEQIVINEPDPVTLAVSGQSNPNTEGGTEGSLTFTTSLSDGEYTLNYKKSGIEDHVSVAISSGTFVVNGLGKGTYSAFYIMHGSCTVSYNGLKTLFDPVISEGVSLVRKTPGANKYQNFTTVNAYLYFNTDPPAEGIRRTDGTAVGTNQVTGTQFDWAPTSRCVAGDHLYYGAAGELRRINGSTGADQLVKSGLHPIPRYMTDLNGILIFTLNGSNLWRSDGTEEGTYQIAEIEGSIFTPVTSGSYVYFATSNGPHGLWRSDGTAVGTFQYNLNTPYSTTNVFPTSLTAWNGTIFCTYDYNYNDGTISRGHSGLAKIDGDALVTLAMTGCHLDCGGTCTSCDGFTNTQTLYPTSSGVYLFGNSAPHLIGGARLNEVWKTDGTPEGTYKVATIGEGSISVPNYFWRGDMSVSPQGYCNIFFFPAGDAETGIELWRSDGTAEGTFRVKDIFPGAESSNPREMAVVDEICYFIANDGEHGNEVWRSDGTEAGTYMVTDLYPGPESGAVVGPLNEASVNMDTWAYGHNGRYYFNGQKPGGSVELYATGGSDPVVINATFGVNLGWCGDCEKELFQILSDNVHNRYMAYAFGDAITMLAGEFTISREDTYWKGQYSEITELTGGNWESNPNFTTNGLSTSPKPPCTGWSHGFGLSGDCVMPAVTVEAPPNAPLMDASAVTTTGTVDQKNTYEIPVTDSNEKVILQWNATLLRWEMVLASPAARIAETTVLSFNPSNWGANPPCSGWSNGYGLRGDICTIDNPLPVTLLYFTVQTSAENVVMLNWSTAAEQNAGHFGIERSADARGFREIAKLAAKGDSYEIKSYVHTDEAPLRGRSYYRLRQVDRDGSYTYSKVVSVRTTGTDAPYPNPAKGGTIRIEARDVSRLKLTDLSGRDISFSSKRIDDEVIELQPYTPLQPGVYVVSNDGVGYRIVIE